MVCLRDLLRRIFSLACLRGIEEAYISLPIMAIVEIIAGKAICSDNISFSQ